MMMVVYEKTRNRGDPDRIADIIFPIDVALLPLVILVARDRDYAILDT